MQVVIKETVKAKVSNTKEMMKVVEVAKNEKNGSFLNVIFKTVGKTLILM